jgi:hypothetical protein
VVTLSRRPCLATGWRQANSVTDRKRSVLCFSKGGGAYAKSRATCSSDQRAGRFSSSAWPDTIKNEIEKDRVDVVFICQAEPRESVLLWWERAPSLSKEVGRCTA